MATAELPTLSTLFKRSCFKVSDKTKQMHRLGRPAAVLTSDGSQTARSPSASPRAIPSTVALKSSRRSSPKSRSAPTSPLREFDAKSVRKSRGESESQPVPRCLVSVSNQLVLEVASSAHNQSFGDGLLLGEWRPISPHRDHHLPVPQAPVSKPKTKPQIPHFKTQQTKRRKPRRQHAPPTSPTQHKSDDFALDSLVANVLRESMQQPIYELSETHQLLEQETARELENSARWSDVRDTPPNPVDLGMPLRSVFQPPESNSITSRRHRKEKSSSLVTDCGEERDRQLADRRQHAHKRTNSLLKQLRHDAGLRKDRHHRQPVGQHQQQQQQQQQQGVSRKAAPIHRFEIGPDEQPRTAAKTTSLQRQMRLTRRFRERSHHEHRKPATNFIAARPASQLGQFQGISPKTSAPSPNPSSSPTNRASTSSNCSSSSSSTAAVPGSTGSNKLVFAFGDHQQRRPPKKQQPVDRHRTIISPSTATQSQNSTGSRSRSTSRSGFSSCGEPAPPPVLRKKKPPDRERVPRFRALPFSMFQVSALELKPPAFPFPDPIAVPSSNQEPGAGKSRWQTPPDEARQVSRFKDRVRRIQVLQLDSVRHERNSKAARHRHTTASISSSLLRTSLASYSAPASAAPAFGSVLPRGSWNR